ncbi:MAG: DUF2652 domain-containing protein [Candidatus Binatia bacterium]
MEAREQRVVLILADISGYTRFILANQTTALHGQLVISYLIETILKEVDIPLTLHGIEGDAVFLSASHPGDDAAWREVLEQVRTRLDRFFRVFLDGIVRMADSTICTCASCEHIEELRLKIVVHSGRAVFSTIAGIPQISGRDVILAHRLLKNSVNAHEYLLMTEAAWQDLGVAMEGHFEQGTEDCEGIGQVPVRVRLMEEDRQRALVAMDALPTTQVVAQARRQQVTGGPNLLAVLFQHLRRPRIPVGWPARIAFVFLQLLWLPAYSLRTLLAAPRRVMEKRRARLEGRISP